MIHGEELTRLLGLLVFFYGLFHCFSLLLETLSCGGNRKYERKHRAVTRCGAEKITSLHSGASQPIIVCVYLQEGSLSSLKLSSDQRFAMRPHESGCAVLKPVSPHQCNQRRLCPSTAATLYGLLFLLRLFRLFVASVRVSEFPNTDRVLFRQVRA